MPDLAWDDFTGRGDERQRWRIYRVLDSGEPELLATTDSAEGVGVCIVTLGAEGEFDDAACGVLDSMPEGKTTGTWVLKPWCASPKVVSAAARVLAKSKRR